MRRTPTVLSAEICKLVRLEILNTPGNLYAYTAEIHLPSKVENTPGNIIRLYKKYACKTHTPVFKRNPIKYITS